MSSAAKPAQSGAKLTPYNQIRKGDLMALVTFVTVQETLPASRQTGYVPVLQVRSVDTGLEFDVTGTEVAEQMFSADRFSKEEKRTKTELAEILEASYNVPFTVVFDKADGTERTLRGRLISAEPKMGRSNVVDLDVTKGSPLRQVDNRTLKSLIVGGVKYTLKK
jgi:hypothetical protein